MSNYTVQEETYYGVLQECMELAKAHYEEVEDKASSVPFNLDLNLIWEYCKMDLIYLVVARDETGEPIGYFANMISPDPITSKPIGKEFGIYVKPEWRGTNVFNEMLKKVEEGAQRRRAYSQLLMFKEGHDVGIAERKGYTPTERVYQKVFEV